MKDFLYSDATDSDRELSLEELLLLEKSALITPKSSTEEPLDLSLEEINGVRTLIIKLDAQYYEEWVEGKNRANLIYIVYLNRPENIKAIVKFLFANGFEVDEQGALKTEPKAVFSNNKIEDLLFNFTPEALEKLDIEGIKKEIAEEQQSEPKAASPPLDERRIIFEKSEENKHQFNNTGYVFKRANGEPITNASEVRKYINQQKKSTDPEISKQFKEDFPVSQKGTSSGQNAPTIEIEGYKYKYYSMLGDPTWGTEEEPAKTPKTDHAGYIGSYVDNKPAKVTTANGIILHDTPDSNDALYRQIKNSVFKDDFLIKKGGKLEIIARSNKDNPGWVMVRNENNVVGWIEERFIAETKPTDVLARYTSSLYVVKKDEQLAQILLDKVPADDLKSAGIQNFAYAFKLLNAGNSGLYFEPIQEDIHNYVITYDYKDIDLDDANTSQLFNSIKLYEGAKIRIPTKAFVEKAKADGLIKQASSDREMFLNMVMFGDTFLGGIYDGFTTAAEDFAQGIWDLVKSIFTGEIFDQLSEMWDFVSNASWAEIKDLFTGAVDDFKSKWFNDNLEERWHYRGEVVGQILFEIVLAIFTGGAALLSKLGQGTKLGKMVTKLQKGVKNLNSKVPDALRKKLNALPASKKGGSFELKSKEEGAFVPLKDTDETLKEAFDREKKEFDEQFEKDLNNPASDLIRERAEALARYRAKGGKMAQSTWEIKYNTLAKNRKIGKIGEDTFKEFMDGYKPKFGIETSNGMRYIDNIKPDTKTAREIKTGRVQLSQSIKKQIDNDIDLVINELSSKVRKVEWHFLDGVDDKVKKYIADKIKENKLDPELIKYVEY